MPNRPTNKRKASVKVSSITSSKMATLEMGAAVGPSLSTAASTSTTTATFHRRQQTISGAERATNSATKSNQSGVGNQTKYLRYVRSKLSKSRLNSMLSLTSKEQTTFDSSSSPSSSQLATPSTAELSGSSASPFATIEGQQQQQQQQLSESTPGEQLLGFNQTLATATTTTTTSTTATFSHQQETFSQELARQPVGASLSICSTSGDQQHENIDQQALRRTRQQQASTKKSNFFQGFRYTLRGRRGPKQQQQLEQSQHQVQHGQTIISSTNNQDDSNENSNLVAESEINENNSATCMTTRVCTTSSSNFIVRSEQISHINQAKRITTTSLLTSNKPSPNTSGITNFTSSRSANE